MLYDQPQTTRPSPNYSVDVAQLQRNIPRRDCAAGEELS